MSGELDCAEENSAHTSNNVKNPRSRGIMLQQSVDRPSEQIRANHGNHVASSIATSALTSPKIVNNGDSVNQSSKRSSHGGSLQGVMRDGELARSKDGFLLHSVPRVESHERSSVQSPSQENLNQ